MWLCIGWHAIHQCIKTTINLGQHGMTDKIYMDRRWHGQVFQLMLKSRQEGGRFVAISQT